MGMLGNVAQIGGTALKAYGAYKEGKSLAEGYRYNEAVARQEGQMIEASGKQRVQQIARKQAQTKGTQRANYSAAGVVVDKGSPFEVAVDTAGQFEMDKATEQFNTEVEKRRAGSREAAYGRQAKNAYSGGLVKMGTTLLSAFSKQVR